MSAPQLVQASPGAGSTAYINQVYPVNAVSKLFQVPATGRIAKLAGTPQVGQALLYAANGAGTVENPDVFLFNDIGTNLSTRGAGRSISFSYPVVPAGQQLSFDDLIFDSSGGTFGNFDTYYVLPDLQVIYQGSTWVQVQVPATAITFDLWISIRMYDPVTGITSIVGAGQSQVTAPGAPLFYRVGCSGNCFPVNAGSTMIVDLFVVNATGALPAMTVVDGGFQIVSGTL